MYVNDLQNTVQLAQKHAISSTKFKLVSTFPSLGYKLRENFRPIHLGLPQPAATLSQICDLIDCFCLSSRRPAGIVSSGLASEARESEFEAGGFAEVARLPPP